MKSMPYLTSGASVAMLVFGNLLLRVAGQNQSTLFAGLHLGCGWHQQHFPAQYRRMSI